MTETLERNYVVPLRRGFLKTAPYKRSKKAITTLKEFISKHMKSDNVAIGKELNEMIWKHGIKNPPSKVSVTAIKDKDGRVSVNLEGVGSKTSVNSKVTKKAKSSSDKDIKDKKDIGNISEAKDEDKKVEKEVKEQKETPKPDDVKPEIKKEPKSDLKEEKSPSKVEPQNQN